MKSGDKIVHLHLHRPEEGLMDFYFKTIEGMCRKMPPNKIGICPQSLRNNHFYERRFYANKFCAIELITLE